MKKLNSYRINDIIENYCDMLEKSDYDTSMLDKCYYLLATHAGTLRNDSRCKCVEALEYINGNVFENKDLGMSMLEELAYSGYPKAIEYVAGKYEKTDVNKAISLYANCLKNPSCDKGYIYYRLGYLYFNFGEKYADAAIKYLTASSDQYNNADAQVVLAEAYFFGHCVEKDIDTAYGYCKRSADSGNSYAQCWLGKDYMFSERFSLETDYELAYKYLKAAADQYDAEAIYYIGLMYYFGEGLDKDWKEAEEYFERAAFFGDIPGGYAGMGIIQYENGNYAEAFKNINKAYEEFGATFGIDYLAKMYRYGQGCQLNNAKAIELYEVIEKEGKLENADARYIADCLLNGYGVPQDKDRSVQYYKKSSSYDPEIMFKLGCLALDNEVTVLSETEAISYLENASLKGHKEAFIILGDYFLSNKNAERALDYYKRAFKNGNADASVKIGRIYETGTQNILKNVKEAINWYQLGVQNGSESAKHELGCFKKTLISYKRISR